MLSPKEKAIKWLNKNCGTYIINIFENEEKRKPDIFNINESQLSKVIDIALEEQTKQIFDFIKYNPCIIAWDNPIGVKKYKELKERLNECFQIEDKNIGVSETKVRFTIKGDE